MLKNYYLLFLGALCLSACDSTPNTQAPDLKDTVPVISTLTYTPKNIIFESLPATQRNGNVATVPFLIRALISDLDSPSMKRVQYTLYQFNGRVHSSGELSKNGGDYTANTNLVLNKAEVGIYSLKVQAIDDKGNFSNFAFGTINFVAEGGAPILSNVTAPAQIQRPSTGSVKREKIIATVTDPDGLGNIAKVVMKALDGSEFELLDDGGRNSISGDVTAGDGQYTITIEITSTNPLGQYPFSFEALDRTGLRSNIISKTIEVIQ